MSDATRARFEEALHEHIADELDGAMLTDWVLQAAAAPAHPDRVEDTEYVVETSGGPFHARLGLAHRLVGLLDHMALHSHRGGP